MKKKLNLAALFMKEDAKEDKKLPPKAKKEDAKQDKGIVDKLAKGKMSMKAAKKEDAAADKKRKMK
jgi:hypothetical protein